MATKPLTEREVLNAKPGDPQGRFLKPGHKPDTQYKMFDGGGLYLLVKPTGGKLWQMAYRFAGKSKTLSFGAYPETSLSEARNKRIVARDLLKENIDPSEHKKTSKQEAILHAENSFEAIAQEWLSRQTDKAEVTRNKSTWLLQFAIKEFGHLPITAITPLMVLAACRKVENEGKLETAKRIKTKCSQVFRYAVATGRAERDPTPDLRGALKPPVVKHRAAIIEPKKVGELLRDINSYSGHITVRYAMKLAALVFIRPGELRAARWDDFNFDEGIWRYVPPKTRNQTQVDHIIPLSTQATQILKSLYPLTSHTPFVFSSWGKEGHLSEAAVLSALRRMGWGKDEMSGHGFRAMARTLLEEVHHFRIEVIEQQLAHVVKDSNGRAYNRTKNLVERKHMMQVWADYLEQLQNGNVVTVNFGAQAAS